MLQSMQTQTRRTDLGAMRTLRRVTKPWQTVPVPKPVYTGRHPDANATVVQQIWIGWLGAWLAVGSRVKAGVTNGQTYIESFIGQKTFIDDYAVYSSQIQMDGNNPQLTMQSFRPSATVTLDGVPETHPQRVGAGALTMGTAALLGFTLLAAGGIGGGLIGAKLSSKHKVGASIAGTLIGALIVPAIVGPIVGGITGGATPPTQG